MTDLHRFTTDYVDIEDRIRISGELQSGEKRVFWLTRRLLDRLVPPLAAWVEKQADPPEARSSADPVKTAATRSFAQQAARAEVPRQRPVDPGTAPDSWLVRSVDLSQSTSLVRLTFKNHETAKGAEPPADAAEVRVPMTPTVLRQWLGIVHDKYRKAGWPTQAFPRWVTDAGRGAAGSPGASPTTLH